MEGTGRQSAVGVAKAVVEGERVGGDGRARPADYVGIGGEREGRSPDEMRGFGSRHVEARWKGSGGDRDVDALGAHESGPYRHDGHAVWSKLVGGVGREPVESTLADAVRDMPGVLLRPR